MASFPFSGCSLKSLPTPSSSSSSPRRFQFISHSRPLSPGRLSASPPLHCLGHLNSRRPLYLACSFISGGSNGKNNGGAGGGGGSGNEGDNTGDRNKEEALKVLADAGRCSDSLPEDLVAAIHSGKIPGSVVSSFLKLEECPLFRWLLQFAGFKERLLADDLFLAKVAIECGVGFFTKISAEYDRRKENIWEELEIVFTDLMMAMIADFMLIYLPAPTVSLRRPLGDNAGHLAKFFHSCPANAFQVAVAGNPYSPLQRMGAFALTGAKLLAVGTASSLAGAAMANAWVNFRKVIYKSPASGIESVPVLTTSIALGSYMAVFSNLRYQVLAGLVEQRILNTLLHGDPLSLCAVTFGVRAGNAYLRPLTQPATNDDGNAPSRNELFEPASNVIGGTRDADVVPPLNILMGVDLNCDWKERKIAFRAIALASFYSEVIRHLFNPPGTSA